MVPFIVGFIFSTVLGVYSYMKGALTKSGIVGAILTGTFIFGFGQKPSWYLLLIIFFVSSSLLSFYHTREKEEVSDIFEKTGKRDLWQALANGGWASILAIIGYYLHQDWVYVAFGATFATVNADTWATEIGVLSRRKPRFILNGKIVEKGTSGGITAVGFLGSVAGSVLIGIFAFLLLVIEAHFSIFNIDKMILMILVISISGVIGALVDSVLGATIQAQFTCQVCGKVTEKKFHCNKKADLIKGLPWMNNDLVNFFSSVVGSIVAIFLYWLF